MAVTRTCRLHWRHTFFGNDLAAIAAVETEDKQTQQALIDLLGSIGDHKPTAERDPKDGELYVRFEATLANVEHLRDELEKLRDPAEKCGHCGKRHEVGDLAHSIDYAVSIDLLIPVHYEHPGQGTLFGC